MGSSQRENVSAVARLGLVGSGLLPWTDDSTRTLLDTFHDSLAGVVNVSMSLQGLPVSDPVILLKSLTLASIVTNSCGSLAFITCKTAVCFVSMFEPD